jgi:hypothetical protein
VTAKLQLPFVSAQLVKTHCQTTGDVRLVAVCVQANAAGSAGPGDWTSPISQMVV